MTFHPLLQLRGVGVEGQAEGPAERPSVLSEIEACSFRVQPRAPAGGGPPLVGHHAHRRGGVEHDPEEVGA